MRGISHAALWLCVLLSSLTSGSRALGKDVLVVSSSRAESSSRFR
jgi:hypothetical protein